VVTLRCTSRLLARLKVEPTPVPPEPTTLLGDWHANLIHVGRQQLVLAVADRTLLPVVVPAAPTTTLVPRFRVALRHVLAFVGVGREAIDREDGEMAGVTYGKTNNRPVMGIMVDFAKLLPHFLERDESLLAVSLKLARTPCSPLYSTTTSPDRAVAAVFGVTLLRVD
jgi:hypothetical protein